MQQVNRSEDPTPFQNTGQAGNGGSGFDNFKSTVADKLHSAASAIREKSGEDNAAADYAQQASQWLDQAADFVHDIKPAQIRSDLQQQVRRNPGRSLLIAGAVGLALGILLRRR